MKILKAEIKNIRSSGIDIKINNGLRDFIVAVDKDNLTYEELINYHENNNIKIKIYSMIRNCCGACPIVILEKGNNKDDDVELKGVMNRIFYILGEELKSNIKNTCTE